jgi:hypothetical protein
MVKIKEGFKSNDVDWIEFGKFMINTKFLNENILLMKYTTYSPITWLPRKKISDKFTQFWNDLIFTQTINYGLLKKCDISDIILFEKLLKSSKVNIQYDRKQSEMNVDDYVAKFEILKGEILIKNDNPEIRNELRIVISKLFELGKLNESDKTDILNCLN